MNTVGGKGGNGKRDNRTDRVARDHFRFVLALYESLHALQDPADIATTAAEQLSAELGLSGSAYLRATGDGSCELLGFHSESDKSEKYDPLMNRAWELVQEQRLPVVVRDASSDERVSARGRQLFREAGAAAAVYLPLWQGEVRAAFVLLANEPREWTTEELDLALYVANYCRSVIERSQVVRDLRESEARYRDLFESIDQGFYVCEVFLDDEGETVDYRFLELNAMFEKLTGIRRAPGRTARELVPDLEEYWYDVYGSVARSGKPVRFEQHSQALGRWFDVYAFRIGGEDSRKVAVLFSNITERKRAEAERERLMEELDLERTRLSQLFQQVPASIAVLRGPDHRFVMANPRYQRLVGNRELIGRTAREAFPDLADQGFFELLDRVYLSGEAHGGRATRIVLDAAKGGAGEELFLDFVYQPLKNADGTVSGIFAHAVDVTEHKRAERELAKAHEDMERMVEERTAELRAVNEELESFNYSVSHDLRAPLRGIDGFSRVLQEEYGDALDETGQHYLNRIVAATGRMNSLIDALLDLSRLTRARVTPRRVDLSELAETIAGEQMEHLPDREIDFEVEPGMVATGDEQLLRIVLENLLGNAIKFTRERDAAAIQMGTSDEGGRRAFYVRDNGVGFDMNYQNRLFTPFQRLQAGERFEGTGLGLAIVQRIIHRHGGRIWAKAKPGEGAAFYFTLGAPGTTLDTEPDAPRTFLYP